MMYDVDPPLLMDLPIAAKPSRCGEPSDRQHQHARRKGRAMADGDIIHVHPDALTIDDRFGLSVDELTARYATEIAIIRADESSGQSRYRVPLVVAAPSGSYAALTELPTVLAAIQSKGDDAGAVPLRTVAVMLCEQPDGNALLSALFTARKARSLYERARYIAGCEARYGSRREWMRTERIDAKKWEPRFSKICKINRLDPDLLALIDPFSITNAEVVSAIVDLWATEEKREAASRIVADEARRANARLNAKKLFRKILDEVEPSAPQVSLSDWRGDQRDVVGADGAIVATISRNGAAWAVSGTNIAALSKPALTSTFEALTAEHRRTCTGASPTSRRLT